MGGARFPGWLAIGCLLLAGGSDRAFGIEGGTSPTSDQPTSDQPTSRQPMSQKMGGRAGVGRYQPGTWGIVAAVVRNSSDQPAEFDSVIYFANDPNLQYARRLWVPAKSRRYSWCPIRLPASIPANRTSVEVKTLLLHRSAKGTRSVRKANSRMAESQLLGVDHNRLITGLITQADGAASPEDELARSTIEVGKLTLGLPPYVFGHYDDFLPPVLESLDGLDQLVLAGDQLASDAAGLVAVRDWLLGGGRLWVMLDRVDPATVELLLGESFPCHVVDRVDLTQFEVTSVGAIPVEPDGKRTGDAAQELEEPVALVRVVLGDGPTDNAADARPAGRAGHTKVTHTIGRWPAAFSRSFGQGRVLVTTLGARGWMRPRAAGDPVPPKPFQTPRFAATDPLRELAAEFFREVEAPRVEPAHFEPYLGEQIGYRIVGRGVVASVLGIFLFVLALGGAWLVGKGRLEYIAWLGLGASAVAALTLIALGTVARQAVPSTFAMGQYAQVEPGSGRIAVSGMLALYHQNESDTPLGAGRGGVFDLDLTGLQGTVRRIVRTDLDTWRWENLSLPPGVRTAPFFRGIEAGKPMEVRGVFNSEGLTAHVAGGPFEDLSDAIVVLPSRRNLAASLDDTGTFTVGSGDALGPGQWVGGSLLGDQKRRRQEVIRRSLVDYPEGWRFERPMLLAWAKPLDMKFEVPEGVRRTGSALLAIPLEIEPTPPGRRVVLPSPFLDRRSVRGPLVQASMAYDHRRHEWLEMRIPSVVCLQFQIPWQVLPMRIDRASVTVRLDVPSRPVELLGFVGRETVVLARHEGAVGTYRFRIDRADLLELDAAGRLLLGIRVGKDFETPADDGFGALTGSSWKVESLDLQIEGETVEPAK